MAGVEPRYVEWDGQGTEAAFVISMNLHRRHLNEGQCGISAPPPKPLDFLDSTVGFDLAEIDENLIRLDIPVIDQADRMKRRQEIYQALGLIPERGGDRKSAEYKEKNQTGIVGVCFSDDTAQKIGVSPSSIFQLIQISKNIGHDLVRC